VRGRKRGREERIRKGSLNKNNTDLIMTRNLKEKLNKKK
jgi:hypothetical protein